MFIIHATLISIRKSDGLHVVWTLLGLHSYESITYCRSTPAGIRTVLEKSWTMRHEIF